MDDVGDVGDVGDDVSEGREGSGLRACFLCQQIRQEPRAKSQEECNWYNWCDSLIVDSFRRKRSNRWRSGFPLDAELLAKANKGTLLFSLFEVAV